MLGLRKRCDYRCLSFLFFYMVSLLISSTWCYDPCPESMRRSTAAKPCNIPPSEVEKAFQKGRQKVEERKQKEKKLVSEGKTVNRRVKSAESTHPQATARPEVLQLERRQLIFQEASTILEKQYKLKPDEVCCGLPRMVLKEPSAARAVQECARNETFQCDASARFRTADGTCNNLNNPTWGSALSCFNRILPPIYTDNEGFRQSVQGGNLPPPRRISVYVHTNVSRPTTYVTHMYMFFGQLLDHDFTLTAPSLTDNNEAIECCPPSPDSHPQCAPIDVTNDPFYSQFNVTCLNFVRSALCPYCTAGPRVQMNEVTAYIDASMVYGNSQNETNSLRMNDGSGSMRVQRSNSGDLLPPSNDPANDACSLPAENRICYQAGDIRVNQHAVLTSLHTLFLREHNRIVRLLRTMYPQWTDEILFQVGRKIVGAEMQVITYKEYLPITIGNERMSYFDLWLSRYTTKYDPYIDATLLTEFSTAAFRFGHSLINTWVAEIPRRPGHSGHRLRDMFFFPFDYGEEMTPLFRGVTRSPAQYFDRHMVTDVTNYLYRIRGNDTGFDLASFNIQRGRDHGLQGYVYYVRFCSKEEIDVQNFDDLVRFGLMTRDVVDVLRMYYRDVRDIDLFTGTICEIWNPGAVIGPTATCMVGLQFRKLKFGDRFYFEHGGQAGSFTQAQINELKKVRLSKIICDNTDISEMQLNAMLYASNDNPILACNQIPGMDLSAWREQ